MKQVTTNIVIAGGGMAGFAAALAAHSEGKSVILIERSDMLGGNATQSNVGTICGAFYRTLKEQPVFAGHNFGRKLIYELISKQVCSQPCNYHMGLYILRYDWQRLHQFLENKLETTSITFLKNTAVISVVKKEDTIASVNIETGGATSSIKADTFIDCTGNATLSLLANAPLITSGKYMAASQVFRVTGIDASDEFMMNMALKRCMLHLILEKGMPESFQSLSIIPGSLRDGCADLKFVLPDVVSDNAGLNNELAIKAINYVHDIFLAIQHNMPLFQNAVIETIFPVPGIRIQQRPKGKYLLTEEDVLACRKFNDGIAIGAWPIEEWGYDGQLTMEYFKEGDGYYIPAGSLQSVEISNLFFAGKNISATDKAIASARVIGTCLQTGYAAGKLASCSNTMEQEKVIAILQAELNNEYEQRL